MSNKQPKDGPFAHHTLATWGVPFLDISVFYSARKERPAPNLVFVLDDVPSSGVLHQLRTVYRATTARRDIRAAHLHIPIVVLFLWEIP